MVEKRRTSTRVRVEKREEKPPESPKVEQRPKKIRKIHAPRKSLDGPSSFRKDVLGASKAQDSPSTQASPAPFNKLNKDSPLPTRPANFSIPVGGDDAKPLQSVAQSGVLAASMSRSKTKWVNEGIFERYWAKPKKSKGQIIEAPNNPPKESMVTIGRSKLYIEPHVFDVSIYGIRDPPAPLLTPSTTVGPLNISNSPRPPVPSTQPSLTPPQPRPFQATTATPVQSTNTMQPAQNRSQLAPPSTTGGNQTSATPAQQSNPQPQQQPGQQTQQPQQPQNRPAANQDPVIQMLAQRASERPDLKALMKIVASGTANKDQLAEFQRHIDELTRQLQQKNASQQQTPQQQQQQPPPPPPGPNTPGVQNSTTATSQARPAAPTTPASTTPTSATNTQTQSQNRVSTQPAYPTNPIQQSRPPPVPAPRPVKAANPSFPAYNRFKGIAIEFLNPTAACNTTPNERLLFPRHTLLAYSPDGRNVAASFLVVKPASAMSSSSTPATLTPGKKVHVPVTIVFESADQQALAHLRAGVVAEEEARRHMDEIVKTTERAPDIELALRLPKSDKHPSDGDVKAIEPTTARRGKRKEEDLEGLCRFCYSPIPDEPTADKDGMILCKACAALKRAAIVSSKITVELPRREIKAGRSLVW